MDALSAIAFPAKARWNGSIKPIDDLMKGIFKRDEEDHPASSRERQIVIERQAEEAEEAMNLLSEKDADDLDETMEEINAAVKKAAKATLQDIRMMEEGRCPACGQKTRQFLFTSVCASCGWFSFISPEEGKSIIHLKTGRNIECGTTFDTQGDYILGITDGVVRAKVTKDNVQHIEYVWSDEEIEKKRTARAREQAGICSWCEKNLTQAEEEVIVVYAAFGSLPGPLHILFKTLLRGVSTSIPDPGAQELLQPPLSGLRPVRQEIQWRGRNPAEFSWSPVSQ